MADDYRWAPGPRITVSEDGKTVRWNEAHTTVAIGTTPLDFTRNFYFQVELKTNNNSFPDAMMVGISNESLYESGSGPVLGSTKKSWGIRVDGKIFHNQNKQKYSPSRLKHVDDSYSNSCLVGVAFDSWTKELRFFDDGLDLGVAFKIDLGEGGGERGERGEGG
eukprot:CAMPEP_0201485096 /NCGR_PEP_ID=MMETSP0151_2-20130828/9233_1 /ASSEMBLY_ACC=CAM_ASM_000257 /TAXON_ID=200890 /ORGANISM="Paramoeba atlantica, Strain 621/1 / CCAP 1560/9" /LENGTH=163 /DNA_ID=CAMNT_0047869075 /DNA_START=32 /DNA_END=519 /DNA_ORIENTATION=+